MKTNFIHNPEYESTAAKHVFLLRIYFSEEYTKIDFGFDHTKIQYIKNERVLINKELFISTKQNSYQLKVAQIYKKPYFNKDSDFRYFSLLFEPVDEDIDFFDIVDESENDFGKTGLYRFSFMGIKITE